MSPPIPLRRTAAAGLALLVGTCSFPGPALAAAPARTTSVALPVVDQVLPIVDRLLFAPRPSADGGLITNEFATYNPQLRTSRNSADWVMSSGSLFATSSPYGPAYASGPVDDREPDAQSTNGTNSAIFRMLSRRADFADVTVRLKLRVDDQPSTRSTPRSDWDGVHLWLRHQSETSTYYASLMRRDGRMVIKKKCPGGNINGGRYYELTDEIVGFPIYPGAWKRFTVSIRTTSSGAVAIAVYRLDTLVLRTVDDGIGCPPITKPGPLGLRGDNSAFAFTTFSVRPSTGEQPTLD